MRALYFAGFFAVAAAVVIYSIWKPLPIEERLVQLQVEQLFQETSCREAGDACTHNNDVRLSRVECYRNLALNRHKAVCSAIKGIIGIHALLASICIGHSDYVDRRTWASVRTGG